MIKGFRKYKYLVSRRITQIGFLVLFICGNYLGWQVLQGNYSFATILDTVLLADPFAFLQILASGYISADDVIIGSLTIFILYTLLGGRVFCSWVCPVNLVTDLSSWLNRKFNINTKLQFSRNYRYWFLAMSLILSAILGFAAFEMISPIGIMHRGIIFGITSAWVVVLALFLFDLAVMKNGWCGHLCPLGAFYSLVGKIGFLKVHHKLEKCTDCMDCFKICPEPQVLSIVTKRSGLIKSGECTNCGRCIDICEDDSLRFTMNYLKRN